MAHSEEIFLWFICATTLAHLFDCFGYEQHHSIVYPAFFLICTGVNIKVDINKVTIEKSIINLYQQECGLLVSLTVSSTTEKFTEN